MGMDIYDVIDGNIPARDLTTAISACMALAGYVVGLAEEGRVIQIMKSAACALAGEREGGQSEARRSEATADIVWGRWGR